MSEAEDRSHFPLISFFSFLLLDLAVFYDGESRGHGWLQHKGVKPQGGSTTGAENTFNLFRPLGFRGFDFGISKNIASCGIL